jgi:hypothetical protein
MTKDVVYIDAAGNPWRVAGRCPYRDLTPGSVYALPGDCVVRVRSGGARPHILSLEALSPGASAALWNTQVYLLERAD